MDYFSYRESAGGRQLFAEDVALSELAERFGTPCYVYSSAALVGRFDAFSRAVGDALLCYSVKANDNLAVIRCLGGAGAGADIVSGGELRRALAAGIAPAKIVFAGVGKTGDEMADALDAGIARFNVESEDELELLAALAAARGLRAPVALRVNPDVDAKTHDKISTGRAQDKFGIEFDRAGALFLSYDYWSTYWFYRTDHRGERRALITSSDGGSTWKMAESRDLVGDVRRD